MCSFDAGVSYSTINTARSGLAHLFRYSNFATIFSDNLLINCMKGLSKQRPAQRKYVGFWNPSILLNFLKTVDVESFATLSYKCATLLKLCSMQRSHTLTLIDIENIKFTDDSVLIVIFEDLKVRNMRRPSFTLYFKRYFDQDICIVHCLQLLLRKTPSVSRLFVSIRTPFVPVSADTISRWVKLMMKNSGIDTEVFSAHSTRGASSSAAVRSIDIHTVLKTADWSSDSTFNKFYCKPIIEGEAMTLFTEILKKK